MKQPIKYALQRCRLLCFFSLFSLPLNSLGQTAQTLSAQDYIDIGQLLNKFNFALDYCINGGNDFADLFVENGQYIIDTGNAQARVSNTREELISLAGGPSCDSRKTPPSSYILHLSASTVIEPTADGARGISYALYPANKANYFNADTAGQLGFYHDEYRKTADGWRFFSRRHELNPVIEEVQL